MQTVRMIGRSLLAVGSLGMTIGCAARQPAAPLTPVQSRLQSDIAYLASPALVGRLTGTPGNDSAAAFIARRYLELALTGPFNGKSCGQESCENSLFQFFRPSSLMNRDRIDIIIDNATQNVAALVPGKDSALRGEYVVVGAHYDHIGRSTFLSADRIYYIHPGADDNASGTASVLELARRFAAHPTRRSILFVNFSAEELGLIGSRVFVGNSPVPLDSIITMVNLDMVGRLRDNNLVFFGTNRSRFQIVVDSIEHLEPATIFHHQWREGRTAPSDQATFATAGIPVLGLFTDYHFDYHKTTDTVDRINFAGMEKIVDFAERFVRAVADGKDRPAHGVNALSS